jgi:glycosyltransferase involved in cell wall biosynthesis
MHVVHFITRLIIGGAQENTLLTVEDQMRLHGDRVVLITGPGLGPEGSLEDRARRNGVDLRILPELHRSIRPWHDWQAYRALKQLLRSLRPDVLHTHSSKAGILGRAAAASVGIPAVHTVHGASFFAGQNRLANGAYAGLERWAARRSARIISVADAMTRQYLAAGVGRPDQYVTISSGMEVEPFLNSPRPRDVVREELGLAPDDIVVGKIARLFHLKGHADVIQAARPVIARHPNVKFLFVGDGLLRESLQAQIADAGLQGHFVFTGLVPPERVPELIHAMDIVVHCSLREGLARVLPQALIAAKPIISYDIDGAREVCVPGETGLLLTPQAIDELVDALELLVASPAMRSAFGEEGRARFTDQFRHETMTRRIREVYAEVIASSPSYGNESAE